MDEEEALHHHMQHHLPQSLLMGMIMNAAQDAMQQSRLYARSNASSNTHSSQNRRGGAAGSSNTETTNASRTNYNNQDDSMPDLIEVDEHGRPIAESRPIATPRSQRPRANPPRAARNARGGAIGSGSFRHASDRNNRVGEADADLRDVMVRELFTQFSSMLRGHLDGVGDEDGRPSSFIIPLFGSMDGGPTGNIGDYVFGQQGLDELLTQLMERHAQENLPPAADQSTLDSLPKIKFVDAELGKKIIFHHIIHCNHFHLSLLEHKECPVCQDDYVEEDELLKLPCNHTFHPSCITDWLKINGTCPVCRFSLVSPKTSPSPDPGGPSSSSTRRSPRSATDDSNPPPSDFLDLQPPLD